jgi:Protein of unknown function (DUF3604)
MLGRVVFAFGLLILSAGWRLLSQNSSSAIKRDQAAGAKSVQQPRQATQAAEQRQYPVIASTQVSIAEDQSDFPSLVSTTGGEFWAAWVEWDGRDSDRVVVRNPRWERSRPSIIVNDGNAAHHGPVMAARGERILCAWSGRAGEDWEVYAAWIDPDGKAGTPQRLTHAAGSDLNPRVVADRAGTITLAWQAFRNGKSDIYARQLKGDQWSSDIRVSPSDANDWEPALAVDSTGVVYIAWDSYQTGDYNVYARSLDRGKLGPIIAVANSLQAEFHASAACDAQGKLWVVYDIAGENWGKDFSQGSGTAAPGSRGLHQSRKIGIRIHSRDGLAEPASAVSTVLTGRMERFAELPLLAFDGNDRPVLVFRHWTSAAPSEIYHFYATRWDGNGWTAPAQLQNSAGQNSQRAAVALGKDSTVQVVYSGDDRDQPQQSPSSEKARIYRIYSASLPPGPAAPGPALQAVTPEKERPAAVPRSRYSTDKGGQRYQLLYGDLHRHTDIRGHNAVDGSILDTYRYALDAAELDFLGTTDHNQATGGRWPDGLRDYQWWWTQKAADMFSNPPAFTGMYAYEHSLATPSGHRNIVFLRRGAPLRLVDRERVKEDNLPERLWEWMRGVLSNGSATQKAVIIPHTFAETTQAIGRWDWENPAFEPVLEIYQGARSSYETVEAVQGEKRGRSQLKESGTFAQDALNKGYRYGFIASSDHGSTHNSYACVYVKEATRGGIIDAMLARRTFAASDDIILDASMNDHAMGEEFVLTAKPSLKIFARARNDLVRIDLVRDGKVVYTVPGKGREFRGTYRDTEAAPGKHYYYVRVIQKDVEAPERDPEMAWGSPFFVTLR